MLELREADRLLEDAQQAAIADDFASADELLRHAARIQEAELGPLHPDLANTLNNLAIVAEKTGRLDDAEALYRRAVAIATTSLPAGHPMIAASRENLDAFCLARGLPIDPPAVVTAPAPETPPEPEVVAADVAANEVVTPVEVTPVEASRIAAAPAPPPPLVSPPSAVRPPSPVQPPEVRPPAPAPPANLARKPMAEASARPRVVPTARKSAAVPQPAPRGFGPGLAWVAIGVVLLIVVFFVMWGWSSPETPEPSPPVVTQQPAAGPERPPVTEPPAGAVPIEQARPPTAAPGQDTRGTPTNQPPVPSPSSGAVTLARAELCRSLATSGDGWRCDPAGDVVSPGRMVLYTRVRAPRDSAVVHRWYQGDTLRQAVTLRTQANATQGYRTYSQLTVDAGPDWRVEVRSASGDLLHQQRFSVQ